MKNDYIYGIIGLLVGVLVGALILGGTKTVQLGATDSNSALQQQSLLTWEQSAATNFTNVRAPLAGMGTSSTAALSFNLAYSTTTATTTQVAGLAASLGDLVLVEAQSSSTNFSYIANVQIASTTSATFQITGINGGGVSAVPGAVTFNLTVLPHASFVAPAAISF